MAGGLQASLVSFPDVPDSAADSAKCAFSSASASTHVNAKRGHLDL